MHRKTLTLWFLPLLFVVSAASAERPPNIIFVLADDLGWSELGCYGNEFHDTPAIDRMAAQGMKFRHAYAAAPVCSPYRAALLTGQYPARIGILDYLRPNSANGLSTDHVTLAERLQDAGYVTGMIGKWHLTGYQHHKAEHEIKPADHGFGWDIAREVKGVGNGANFWPYVFRTQPIRWTDIAQNRMGPDEYLTDRMNLEAVDFIQRNHDRPFFLYVSHFAPHSILNGRPDLVQKYQQRHPAGPSTRERCYLCEDQGHPGDALHHWAGDHNPHLAAMLESIDDGVGLITKQLQTLGLDNNTILIFTSDNGGETNVTSNAPLRGGKSQLYEGGIRVPLIVRWPGVVKPGTVNDHPTMNIDFYPTLLEAAQQTPHSEHTVDGQSLTATLKNPESAPERDALFWHYPLDNPHFLGGISGGAIRSDDWKLIENFQTGQVELYSLRDDPSEQKNTATSHPDRVAALQNRLAMWRETTQARTPPPPLLNQPGNLYFADHFSPTQVSDRWFFNGDWSAEDGVLQRADGGSDTTRIFLRDASFRNVVIRFDFQMQESTDLRLLTGSSGHYNAVIHIRPDHFYIQTAKDDRGPWFSYRHGECAYPFQPDRWYTMTVEFSDEQLVAHVDHEHLAFAEHPILNRDRTYFAFQADEHPMAIDNVQILHSRRKPDTTHAAEWISRQAGRHPVKKELTKALAIQKTNAHEWLYQRDATYRSLVIRVAELDANKKTLFPSVHRTHKEIRTEIQSRKKKLLENDPKYKQLLFATFRAARAIDEFLETIDDGVRSLPDNRRKRRMEELRQDSTDLPEYQEFIRRQSAA